MNNEYFEFGINSSYKFEGVRSRSKIMDDYLERVEPWSVASCGPRADRRPQLDRRKTEFQMICFKLSRVSIKEQKRVRWPRGGGGTLRDMHETLPEQGLID